MERVTIAPRIETDRLILREFRREDFDAYCAMLAQPDVGHFIGGVMTDRTAAWEKFTRAPGFWALLGYGMWIVEEKASGRMAGNIGFGDFQRPMKPPLPDLPEGAWVFDQWAHGKGYASEALAAALDWADTNLNYPKYCCIISPDNEPSITLARKFGFVETRRSLFKDEDILVFERPVFR
ncbi:GNAT family N-acetyltransferase [Parasphingopyxis sp.]|uniref:GNAT family N-acetyltransferase n=1 Tax=Parasphingopyxis sp. TaxID=1920299 RepID=UPI00260D14FB|nr:GNAT family N-acetyltransferase [Parasphingopyxis sp.]